MPSNSISDNTLTLQTYKSKLQKYIDSTPEKINDAELPWIDTSLGLISPKEKILELGSGFGRNAVYIQSKGYDIECTDAVADFIPIMQSRQLDARLLDALTDDFGGGYGLVFANGVLVHFTHDERGM